MTTGTSIIVTIVYQHVLNSIELVCLIVVVVFGGIGMSSLFIN
jgi:intracellular septation protein A